MKLTWSSCNWLVHKLILSSIKQITPKYAKGIMLDIGCADKPYESVFAPYIEKHIGLDHQDSLHSLSKVDIIATAYNTTLLDESVDTVLCTAVLEHLERPCDAIKEMYRVLSPGGHVILTAPLFWHIHEEPRDFYRYTKYGLEYIFRDVGFDIVEIIPLSGFIVTFGQELVYFLLQFRRGIFRWAIDILSFIIQSCVYYLNHFDHSYNFTWMYLVVAIKPDREN